MRVVWVTMAFCTRHVGVPPSETFLGVSEPDACVSAVSCSNMMPLIDPGNRFHESCAVEYELGMVCMVQSTTMLCRR